MRLFSGSQRMLWPCSTEPSIGTAPSAAPRVGRSNEGKPGTCKDRFGKTQRKWGKR